MATRGEVLQAQVMDALSGAEGPLSAYAILEELRSIHPKIAPTTVYRALSALSEQGRVHRLESLNAYMTCQHQDHPHDSVLSICDDCGTVEESIAPEVMAGLASLAGQSGFAPTRQVVEIHGTCAECVPERDVK